MGYSAGRDLLPPVLRDLARHSAEGQTVAVIDARGEAYRNLAAGHRHASLFSSPPWIEAVGTAYGLRIEASARLRDGRVEAAVPFCRIADIRGERIACLPFSDYCDPLVEDPADWADLVAPILAAGVPVRLRCLRNALPTADDRFRVAGHALWHGVDLRRGEDEIWAGLDGQARQNVRKAERHGVVVRRSFSLDDLRLFHGMHASLRKSKYRMLAQPFAFFEALHAALAPEERISVLLAEMDGAAVAGILFLEWGDTLYYKFNASIDTHFRPNDLLLWEGIRFGRGRGLAEPRLRPVGCRPAWARPLQGQVRDRGARHLDAGVAPRRSCRPAWRGGRPHAAPDDPPAHRARRPRHGHPCRRRRALPLLLLRAGPCRGSQPRCWPRSSRRVRLRRLRQAC